MNIRSKIFVVVVTMEDELRADVARARLMVAGIPCEIRGNSVIHWNPFAEKVPATYAIMVPSALAQKAKKILHRT